MPPKSKAKASSSSATLKRVNEEALTKKGCWLVVGADEAGRGPLCGPVVVAACYVPPGTEDYIEEIRDSKELDEAERESGYEKLMKVPGLIYAVETLDEVVIDSINILASSMLGMARCALRIAGAVKSGMSSTEGAFEAPQWCCHQLDDEELLKAQESKCSWDDGKPLGILIDGPRLPVALKLRHEFQDSPSSSELPKETKAALKCSPCIGLPIIKGDATEVSIAAASVIAKVERDRQMVRVSEENQGWSLETHKGYPCPEHKHQLTKDSPLKIHRWSFRPVLEALVRVGRLPSDVLKDEDMKKFVLGLRRELRERGLDADSSPSECYEFVELKWREGKLKLEAEKEAKKKQPKAKGKAKKARDEEEDEEDEEGVEKKKKKTMTITSFFSKVVNKPKIPEEEKFDTKNEE